ncbi:enoyl-CoA hydratase/isomerase family protein [Pontibacter akesuensis]|uniref:Enoyl-CoA hydratase n=1 Tax=Pontibacter akesuensis TaxID=388950 RepID=A0A1I7K9R9_9BACT|nr:enoyl-CoA hydratase-related protein [Pontibacter akesuensis]GHA73907.1 enoyl-CoA hydratase [Pontibacter akesuensis]SFU94167.1 enoyl-CoA hydratase [Pontibacter akesuensis]
MATYDNLLLDLQNGILTITVNRADKLNALNIDTISEIRKAIQYVYDTPEIKGVILTGAGQKAFVAGADIAEIGELSEVNARSFAERGQEVFAMIERSNKPVIAAVNGFALGGGCELAMACHLRVASENARFGQPEVNLGLLPGYGGTQRLTQLIGKGKAMELMLTADMITAQEALQLGLANHVVPQEQLLAKATEILQKIMSKAPLAIGLVIECVNAVFNKDENGYQTEANAFARCCASDDFVEGTSAFVEKRKANFIGN